jgi:hypothetical protein
VTLKAGRAYIAFSAMCAVNRFLDNVRTTNRNFEERKLRYQQGTQKLIKLVGATGSQRPSRQVKITAATRRAATWGGKVQLSRQESKRREL